MKRSKRIACLEKELGRTPIDRQAAPGSACLVAAEPTARFVELVPEAANELWQADVTYIHMGRPRMVAIR